MQSRIEKYYNSAETNVSGRTKKNEDLYKTVANLDLEKINLNTNISVLGDSKDTIDIEKLKSIVAKQYVEAPKRKSISVDTIEAEEIEEIDETKDYDINTILEKARTEKRVDYEKDRLKKLRDTQYNILKNLNLELGKVEEFEEIEEVESKTSAQKLMTLINTITEKELVKEESKGINPLDILTDLKGDDNTKIIAAIKPETINAAPIQENKLTEKHDTKKYFTGTLGFNQSDFDDLNDLKEDVKTSKTLIKILTGLIAVALIVGFIVLLNSVLDFGWFK